jgi:hypothetical protein
MTRQRWHLAKRAVRPVLVVVRDIVCLHHLEMSPFQEQHAVRQPTTHRPYPPLRDGVRPRRSHRRPQDPDAVGDETVTLMLRRRDPCG